MSLYNWWYDLVQEGKIDEQQESINQLTKRIEVIEGWIRYLDDRITKIERQQKEL